MRSEIKCTGFIQHFIIRQHLKSENHVESLSNASLRHSSRIEHTSLVWPSVLGRPLTMLIKQLNHHISSWAHLHWIQGTNSLLTNVSSLSSPSGQCNRIAVGGKGWKRLEIEEGFPPYICTGNNNTSSFYIISQIRWEVAELYLQQNTCICSKSQRGNKKTVAIWSG